MPRYAGNSSRVRGHDASGASNDRMLFSKRDRGQAHRLCVSSLTINDISRYLKRVASLQRVVTTLTNVSTLVRRAGKWKALNKHRVEIVKQRRAENRREISRKILDSTPVKNVSHRPESSIDRNFYSALVGEFVPSFCYVVYIIEIFPLLQVFSSQAIG